MLNNLFVYLLCIDYQFFQQLMSVVKILYLYLWYVGLYKTRDETESRQLGSLS